MNIFKPIITIIFFTNIIFAQSNWKITYKNNNFIDNVKLINQSGDSLEFSLRNMKMKTPIDSIIELRNKIGGAKNGFKQGAIIGLSVGIIYGLAIVVPNFENFDEGLFYSLKTTFSVGTISSLVGIFVGILRVDEVYNFTDYTLEEKNNTIERILK